MTSQQPAPPTYVDLSLLDPCELPDLLIVENDKVSVPQPGRTWACIHGTTWTAVPVGIRGGVPQMAWIIRPPGDAPTLTAS